MTLETETVLDRRRLRRHVTGWRAAAVAAFAIAIGAVAFSGDRMAGLSGHQIARVAFEGGILENRDQLKMLKKIADAKNVDALLVFVNSPGGTTTGGEAIYEALREVAKKKPVVAQFGTVAASAGYIVGLGADHIVTRGNTITGSIGVIVQWPEVSALLDKLGVKMNEVKSGVLKATPNFFEPPSEASREVMQKMIGDSFQWFTGLVESRRGIKVADVDGLIKGRIFSGREATAVKLADEIGGEAEAVRWLEKERGIKPDLKVVDWKPQSSSSWGLTSSASRIAGGLLGEGAADLMKVLTQDRTLSTLGLDGLVSVWHPAEN